MLDFLHSFNFMDYVIYLFFGTPSVISLANREDLKERITYLLIFFAYFLCMLMISHKEREREKLYNE